MSDLEKYGNELQITGVLIGNSKKGEILVFPDSDIDLSNLEILTPTEQELSAIINQLDTLQITGLNKIVLRKSQRQIDLKVSWTVFKRDGYKCRYCGNDHTPLTVDHIVCWEQLGDSVMENLMTSCRNCNKNRGNTIYEEWLKSPYYNKVNITLTEQEKLENIKSGIRALTVPLRKHQRSR